MTDIISPDTNLDLVRVAQIFTEKVAIPYVANLGRFAATYLGDETGPIRTLVTGPADMMAVNIEGRAGNAFLNIDILAEAPAVIVEPGINPSTDRFERTVVRPLTEEEGRGLTEDLARIVTEAPADRRRGNS